MCVLHSLRIRRNPSCIPSQPPGQLGAANLASPRGDAKPTSLEADSARTRRKPTCHERPAAASPGKKSSNPPLLCTWPGIGPRPIVLEQAGVSTESFGPEGRPREPWYLLNHSVLTTFPGPTSQILAGCVRSLHAKKCNVILVQKKRTYPQRFSIIWVVCVGNMVGVFTRKSSRVLGQQVLPGSGPLSSSVRQGPRRASGVTHLPSGFAFTELPSEITLPPSGSGSHGQPYWFKRGQNHPPPITVP